MFSWWYPGGFRCGENSDFGIINPDGSDRPVTKVIRKLGPQLLNYAPANLIDHWITIDRDARAEGLTESMRRCRRSSGGDLHRQDSGLRTAGTGTDSTNCPPLAWATHRGTGPTRRSISTRPSIASRYRMPAADGSRSRKADASRSHATSRSSPRDPDQSGRSEMDRPHRRQQARCRIPDRRFAGASRIAIPNDVPRFASVEIKDIQLVPAGVTKDTQVVITLFAEGRTPFGEKFAVTLVPK